ncbi:MAG: Fic family protein [Bacteriovoracaceae bacterium]|nr:Fic family protein [Bacteriovoracaceae bacterium]
MNLKDFISGTFDQQYQYKSFRPVHINHDWVWEEGQVNVLLETAIRRIGELNAYSLLIPNIDLFIQMHIVKEAHYSSRIEGTKTEMDEALLSKENVSPEKRNDWQEVQNYIKAMNHGIKKLEKLPLSNRLLKEMHEILLKGVRGSHKAPGEFRSSQNWIGGSSLTDAVYIPPHHTHVADLMGDLENFLHNFETNVPHMIRVAIAHYQFETIHPFLDGNGRIGRLLITFYLVSNGLLRSPCLYLSAFFEKHKTSYYQALSRVREQNDMSHWIKFFLNAVIETTENGILTFKEIIKLSQQIDRKILKMGRRAEKGKDFIQLLYKKPNITASEVEKSLDITLKSAISLTKEFLEMGILHEMTGGHRNRIYVFSAYLALFDNETTMKTRKK